MSSSSSSESSLAGLFGKAATAAPPAPAASSSSSSESSRGGLFVKRIPTGAAAAAPVEDKEVDAVVDRLVALLRHEDDGTLRSTPLRLHENTFELYIPDRAARQRPVETTAAEDQEQQYFEYETVPDMSRERRQEEEDEIEYQLRQEQLQQQLPQQVREERTRRQIESDDLLAYALDNLQAIDPWYEASEREVMVSGFVGTGVQATQLMRSKYRQKFKMSQRLLMIYQFFCMYLMFPKRPRRTKIFTNMVVEVLGMKIKQGSSYEILRLQKQLVILLLRELSV